MRHILCIIATTALFAGTASACGNEHESWQPMWDVSGHPIAIVIEDISEDAREIGITEKTLTEILELGLRRNNIPVNLEPGSEYAFPYVWVMMMCMEIDLESPPYDPEPAFVCDVDFEVKVPKEVKGWDGLVVPVNTWTNGVLTRGHQSSLKNNVRQVLSDFIDDFSLGYWRSNDERLSSLRGEER